jgi:hypothetical protein
MIGKTCHRSVPPTPIDFAKKLLSPSSPTTSATSDSRPTPRDMNRNGEEVTLKAAIAVRGDQGDKRMRGRVAREDANEERAGTEQRGHHGEHPVPVQPPQGERAGQQQHGAHVRDWRFEPAWAFGHLAMVFWNWPLLADSFIADLSRQLDHRVVIIAGRR